ncbi:MAG TPA: hypothetical protein VN832_07160 [Stellaceae bacterium]|nr:hypothetical protein [Stellaceae bacterium]
MAGVWRASSSADRAAAPALRRERAGSAGRPAAHINVVYAYFFGSRLTRIAAELMRVDSLVEEVMVTKRASMMIIAAACAALLTAPTIAAAQQQGGATPMSSGSSTPMKAKAPAAHKMAHHPVHRVAMHGGKHKWSCYDYAWQSQDMKDCLAKSGKS